MLFNSLAFVVFFPLAVGGYFLTPHRWRWMWLLATSYLFYGWWRADYLLLIMGSTLVDYWVGLKMGEQATKKARKPYLWVSLMANLGMLFTFKYLGFFGETANAFLGFLGRSEALSVPSLLLPVGISFYTFQTLSYSVDVYRGHKEAEKHLGIFAVYVSFFPQLVAGPIERSRRLLPQFHDEHAFDAKLASSGLRLMLWGFFIKCVIADRIAPYVAVVFADPSAYAGPAAWGASLGFVWQIYGDFGGYSLIAIGAARVMGFRLMTNFRRPYFSSSMGEIWRRWHISLMSWFRDYVYAPLGGGKKGPWRGTLNVFAIFVLSGLWHGAAWTFIIFGFINGVFLTVGRLSLPRRNKMWAWLQNVLAPGPLAPEASREGESGDAKATARGWQIPVKGIRHALGIALTLFLWMISAILFRSASLADALVVMKHLFVIPPGTYTSVLLPGFDALGLALIATFVAVHFAVDVLEERGAPIEDRVGAMPLAWRWTVYIGVSLVVVLFGSYGEVPFIYFQF